MPRAFDVLSFADTIEQYPEGVAYVGAKTEIEDCNETFRRMTGIGEGPLQRLDTLIHPSHFEAWSSGLARFLSDRSGVHRLILRLQKVGASDRWVRLSLLSSPDSGLPGFLILLSDITGQKRLEMKLIRARDQAERATRSKSEFLANTSHEIRTPIHTVISTSELLSETSLDQEQSEYLSGIQFAADVLLTLINDILDFSKIEAGQLQLERTDFQLIDMLEDATDMVTLEAHKKNVDIGLYVSPSVPSAVYGDPTRLRQVVVNLINNAVKFTHEGQVVLDVECLDSNEKSVRLKFSVADSGIGIPFEKQSNLFQAFHQADSSTTRQFGGTGLGLFISRNLVAQMGGVLSFESEPEVGSTFFFDLEMDRADKGEELPLVPGDFFSDRRVLIADDNDVIRERLGKTLESWGLSVSEAGSADEALFLMRSAQSLGFDLVVVDQTMPRVDGWQFASEVHSDPSMAKPPMILMSMKGGSGTVEAKMKLLGWFDSYLTKPIRQRELAAAVFRLLAKDLDLEEAVELEEVEDDASSVELAPVSGRTILIAEDHEVNRRLLRVILEKNGHEVLEAGDGQEALSLVISENPDLVFMDCQMPVMNGYESTRQIREGNNDIPIVAVTASALAEEREKCSKAGMNDLITKPFKQADIVRIIERYLGMGPVTAENTITRVTSLKHDGFETFDSEIGELEPVPDDEADLEPLDSDEGADDYSTLPIFDFDTAVATFLGNRETVLSLLEPQMTKIEKDMEVIHQGLSSGDWDAVRAAAHSIKGSCRNMDMLRCGMAAGELEAAAKNGNASGCEKAAEKLDQEYPVLRSAVDEILKKA